MLIPGTDIHIYICFPDRVFVFPIDFSAGIVVWHTRMGPIHQGDVESIALLLIMGKFILVGSNFAQD